LYVCKGLAMNHLALALWRTRSIVLNNVSYNYHITILKDYEWGAYGTYRGLAANFYLLYLYYINLPTSIIVSSIGMCSIPGATWFSEK
jgi:hypothetical protein